MNSSPSFTLLAPALGLLAVACSPVLPEDVPEKTANDVLAQQTLLQSVEEQASGDRADDCLLMVWSENDDTDIAFDRANDIVTGGAISCATGTTPTRFKQALEVLRDAAQTGDKAQLLEQVGLPLLYVTEDGERRELDQDEVDTLFDEVFDARMLEVLQNLDLSKMAVDMNQGAYFELGTLWLVVDETGQPRVMTVNRQALDEAMDVARDKAEAGDGAPID